MKKNKKKFCDGKYYCSPENTNVNGVCNQCGLPKMLDTKKASISLLRFDFKNWVSRLKTETV